MPTLLNSRILCWNPESFMWNFQCPSCDKMFDSNVEVYAHMYSHGLPKKLGSDRCVCCMEAVLVDQLGDHIKNVQKLSIKFEVFRGEIEIFGIGFPGAPYDHSRLLPDMRKSFYRAFPASHTHVGQSLPPWHAVCLRDLRLPELPQVPSHWPFQSCKSVVNPEHEFSNQKQLWKTSVQLCRMPVDITVFSSIFQAHQGAASVLCPICL